MAVPAHLIIAKDGLPFDALLSDWRWLIPSDYTPILVTAFGDLFLQNPSGQIFFLDLMSADFKQVATSREEFDQLCEDRERRRSWFIGFLLIELRKLRGELEAGECYSCKIPLSLGGQLESDNFERTNLEVHYSILGQLHRQTKHLPAGTKINGIKLESPHETAKPKSWWQKLAG